MDLLGGYDSDSDSDQSNDEKLHVAVKTSSTTTSIPVRSAQDTKHHPPTKSVSNKPKSKADRKKRVMGKKLLKLSSVLPEHILNQLQQGGGGSSKEKYNAGNDSDDSSDDDSENDDIKKPASRRKTATPSAASSKDYSRDEGLMGLLSDLSKSSSSASSRKPSSSQILGSDKNFSPFVKEEEDPPATQQSPPRSTERPKAPTTTTTKSEPLGAAFLTTTVETTIRKRKGPATVRNIHEDTTISPPDGTRATTSVHAPKQESSVPRPTISNVVPKPRITPSVRTAAPPIRAPSAPYRPNNVYPSSAVAYGQMRPRSLQQQQPTKKKKPLSRKKQMEQMLRAGKLDEIEGDRQLEGGAHEYNLDGDAAAAAASMMASSAAGVRVVPTSSYDPSLGGTSMSTKVTSRQKNTNQLNSLLANAASLETKRIQNPQLMGQKGKRGLHNAAMKRKYGW